MAFVSAQSARAAYCGRLGYDVEQGLKVFMGLVTAPAMACALDALVKDTVGVSNRSIVVGGRVPLTVKLGSGISVCVDPLLFP